AAVSRARRSRPHARHGIFARYPPRASPSAAAGAAPDAVLQRDDAGADRRAVAGNAEEPEDDQPRAALGARGRDHARALPGATASQTVAPAAPADVGRDARCPRVHADEASGEQAREVSRWGGVPRS